MSSNEKIQVMENIIECMNTYGINITLSELKKYQYIDLKNKIFTVFINKVFQDYKKMLNTDKKLDNGLYTQFDRYPELYVDEKHFKISEYNFIKVINNLVDKLIKFIDISKNKKNINSKLKIFFKENFNYEIPPENIKNYIKNKNLSKLDEIPPEKLNTNINFEKIKNDIKNKNLSKLDEILFFLNSPNKKFINLFKNNIEFVKINNDLNDFFKNDFNYEIIINLINSNKIDETKIDDYLNEISEYIKYNNAMLDDVIDLFFSKIENTKIIEDISKNIEDNKKNLDDIKKSFYRKIKNTEKNTEKATEEAINSVEEIIKAKEEIIKAKEEIIKAKEEDIQKDKEKLTIDLFFNKIGIQNNNDLKENIKLLFNNTVQIDIANFFHLYYDYIRLNKNLKYLSKGIGSGFKESNDIKYYFNTEKKYLIIKSYLNFISERIDSNSLEKIITYYIYIDINTFLEKKGFYLFFKINKFYEDDIKNIALNKNFRYLQYFNNEKKNKDFYILSFNENAKNYTESDSNHVVGGIVQLNPSVLIICTQESGSGTIKNFQKILQKRLNDLNYKLISHRDESKTIIKLGNKNVRTYFYINIDKINFGDTIKKKFKTSGKKRLFIYENRNVTEQERNNDNKSIELINYEWKRSKKSFGYKGANTIGRVLKGTIYKGAICLKVSLKYNNLEHSFIIVNTNFSNNNRKQDQFDNVCKEFNLENEINNSTIFFCGDLNFNIDNSKNELNNYIKNHIVLYQNVSDKMKNLYKKFLDCINNIDINKRLPNRIIYAISDKDKYDVDINKDNFGSIQIKEGSNMSSFEFNFMKNNANKLNKLIEAMPNIRTVQNLKRIANITANMNVPENFEDKYREVLKMMSQKANKNISPNLSGVINIFNEMSGDNLDEFIFFGNYDIGEIKEYEKTGSKSEYINNIFRNNEKLNEKGINSLINNSLYQNILKKIFYRSSGGLSIYPSLYKLIEKGFSKNHIKKIAEKSIYVNTENNKLFILIKELTYFYLDLTYDNFKFPPIYSLLSYIYCDIKTKKFYIFIKPIIKFIDFTNYLINGNKTNMSLIDTKCNNILSNFEMYHDKIKRDNIKYYSDKYILKDFYLVSFDKSKQYDKDLILTLIEQIQIQNPVFVIVFQKDITSELEKRSYIILNKYSKNTTYIYINSNILKYEDSINNKYYYTLIESKFGFIKGSNFFIDIKDENQNDNLTTKIIFSNNIQKKMYSLSFLNCKKLSKVITLKDTFIIGNLSKENNNFITKYNNDNSIYKTDTFRELKDNTKLYETFKNTEYLNSIDTLRIHPENRIVYNNNNYNIYVNPYDLNFYGNIETLSFRIIPKVNSIYNKLIKYIVNYNINSKNKEVKFSTTKTRTIPNKNFFDNYIENLRKKQNKNENDKKIIEISNEINKLEKNDFKKYNSIKALQNELNNILNKRPNIKENIKNNIEENIEKDINQETINFFNSDVDDVYKFKIGEVLYFNNDLKKLLNNEILNSKYYPYS